MLANLRRFRMAHPDFHGARSRAAIAKTARGGGSLARPLLILITFFLAVPSTAFGEQVSHQVSADGNTETWSIREPLVNSAVTEYPGIRFRPGDSIRMSAQGCVQTGGQGRTWKRYVNPSGPNSAALYQGTIWIPGVIGNLPPQVTRFKQVNGQTVRVVAMLDTSQLYLRLGYVDDNYGDNGYWGRDAGTENQCVSQPNASVTLTVTHGIPDPAPFDLVSPAVDDNLIPLNPMWGYQTTHAGQPPSAEQLCAVRDQNGIVRGYAPDQPYCTSQVTSRDDAHICGPHGNWGVATVVGPIAFESHSTGIFSGDDDYSWYLDPPNGNGLTASRATLEPEFNASETIDHFSTPWWNALHSTVDINEAAAKVMVNGKMAIVTGLFGLDFEHTIHAELHPVFAMAIRVNESPNDETWAIFVRRYGNEGYCSSNMHYLDYLPQNRFVFRLPLIWGANASLMSIQSNFIAENPAPAPLATFVPGHGVLISFDMSQAPSARQLIHGELHLRWSNATAAIPSSPQKLVEHPSKQESGIEEYYEELVEGMNPAQLTRLKQLAPSRPVVKPSTFKLDPIDGFTVMDKLPDQPLNLKGPVVVSAPNTDEVERRELLIEAIHGITGTTAPARQFDQR